MFEMQLARNYPQWLTAGFLAAASFASNCWGSESVAWKCSGERLPDVAVAINLAERFPTVFSTCTGSARASAVRTTVESERALATLRAPIPQIRIIEAPPRPLPFPVRSMPSFESDGQHAHLIHKAGVRHGVDPKLLNAIIKVESAHNPMARSPKGAIGLMQVMPGTAQRFGVDDAQSLYRPEINIDVGTRYVVMLQKMFGERLDLVLAAYNAGENAVKRHGNRIPPYPETQQYVVKVLGLLDRSQRRGE